MGPPAARLVDPYSWCNVEDYAWTGNNTETLIDFIYEVTRIVVGIQVSTSSRLDPWLGLKLESVDVLARPEHLRQKPTCALFTRDRRLNLPSPTAFAGIDL